MAFFLRKQGYEAYAIEGGLDEWKAAGYPVAEKEDPCTIGGRRIRSLSDPQRANAVT